MQSEYISPLPQLRPKLLSQQDHCSRLQMSWCAFCFAPHGLFEKLKCTSGHILFHPRAPHLSQSKSPHPHCSPFHILKPGTASGPLHLLIYQPGQGHPYTATPLPIPGLCQLSNTPSPQFLFCVSSWHSAPSDIPNLLVFHLLILSFHLCTKSLTPWGLFGDLHVR